MKREKKLPFDPKAFLSKVNGGRAISDYRKDQNVYTQGQPADSVFYIQSGKVKKTVVSEQGKEAVVALLDTGDFFGEGCLTGQPRRLSTVSAVTECVIVRIAKADITRVIHEEPAFAELFIAHLLACNSRVEEDLVDQLFNSSEKRLARMLLLLANFGKVRSAGADHSENQPRDTGGDDRHDAISREFFHEQIPRIGSH
jgi:CRP/FNR family transcriptional regulator, cyclic AMP receptor protein